MPVIVDLRCALPFLIKIINTDILWLTVNRRLSRKVLNNCKNKNRWENHIWKDWWNRKVWKRNLHIKIIVILILRRNFTNLLPNLYQEEVRLNNLRTKVREWVIMISRSPSISICIILREFSMLTCIDIWGQDNIKSIKKYSILLKELRGINFLGQLRSDFQKNPHRKTRGILY